MQSAIKTLPEAALENARQSLFAVVECILIQKMKKPLPYHTVGRRAENNTLRCTGSANEEGITRENQPSSWGR